MQNTTPRQALLQIANTKKLKNVPEKTDRRYSCYAQIAMPSPLICATHFFARSSDISGWLSSSNGQPTKLSPRTDFDSSCSYPAVGHAPTIVAPCFSKHEASSSIASQKLSA